MKLALKIDVDTWRGTQLGVPRLMETLQRREAGATFLFSLGPDHTGRAIRRMLRPGFMRKVSRTSVLGHYGLVTLMYGLMLPGPDIGKHGAGLMRAARDAGFEVGIHCWDHVKWQDGVEQADLIWTTQQMQLAVERFAEIFGEPAHAHGAAGWQMNAQAFRLEQHHEFLYASDTRGYSPFLPVVNGELVRCPQLPTTLPTLDELIGVDGLSVANVHQRLLDLTDPALGAVNHVFTLHAELEGMKLRPVLEKLIDGWIGQGYELVALRDLYISLDSAKLPHCEIERRMIPGRSGTLMQQGRAWP